MYACMTPVGFDTSDKFENHCSISLLRRFFCDQKNLKIRLYLCKKVTKMCLYRKAITVTPYQWRTQDLTKVKTRFDSWLKPVGRRGLKGLVLRSYPPTDFYDFHIKKRIF